MDEELRIKIKLEALITEKEGMIAENQNRLSHNQLIAYEGESFILLRQEILDLLKE